MEDRETLRQVPELPGDLGARSRATGAALRVLRIGSARALRADKESFRPESVLPFKIAETSARDGIRAWYGRLWLAPNASKRRALTDTVKGVYLPYWTFDAQVEATWTAEAGYTTTRPRATDGGGRVQTRQVQHVRWEPAAGRSHFFDDDLVCASVGVHPNLVRGVEPFPAKELKPYDPGYVAGWVVERYQIDLVAAARAARQAMDAELRRCARADTGRYVSQSRGASGLLGTDVQAHPRAHLALTYNYGTKAYQAAMNGFTGAIQGEYPKSPWKIALLVLVVVVVVIVFIGLAGKT